MIQNSMTDKLAFINIFINTSFCPKWKDKKNFEAEEYFKLSNNQTII